MEIFGIAIMVGPIIKVGIRWDILVKVGIGNRGMDMVEGMAMGIKISRDYCSDSNTSHLPKGKGPLWKCTIQKNGWWTGKW